MGIKRRPLPISLFEYTKSWIEGANCGGLCLVTDEFFTLVRKTESEVRKILTVDFLITYCGEDVKEAIMAKLNGGITIQKLWVSITKVVYNNVGDKQFAKKLRIEILKKWCNIRVGAFLNAYVQIIR